MAAIEGKSSPGIGEVGKIKLTNLDTRAVLVHDSPICLGELANLTRQFDDTPTSINRKIIKAISTDPVQIGHAINGSGFVVEAAIPFSQGLHWLVVGKNTRERSVSKDDIQPFQQKIQAVAENPAYQTQSGKSLVDYARAKATFDIKFVTIDPSNFSFFETPLREVYAAAFKSYPYDVVAAIKDSCGQNVFVAAIDGDTHRIMSITGAELMTVAGINIAEVGDSASIQEAFGLGLGPLLKRYLLQMLYLKNKVPSLVFTDSRIADDAAVLKANRRAGFTLNPEIILPNHTEISSARDPGKTTKLVGANGEAFYAEHMTMTYVTGNQIEEVLSDYGGIQL